MADSSYALKTQELLSQLSSINKSRLLRPELGVESFEEILAPILEELTSKTSKAIKVVPYVSTSSITTFNNHLEVIITLLAGLTTNTNSEFVARKSSIVDQLNQNLDTIRSVWPNFYTSLQEYFPESTVVQQSMSEASALIESVKAKSEAADETLRRISATIEQTNKISEAAQNTAKGVSIGEAQTQFSNEQSRLYIKAAIAAIGSIIFMWWFFVLAFEFMGHANNLEDIWTWKIAYQATIRALILGSIIAIATFFMSLFRAYLHLLEHNSHRQIVANSTEAFVAAAESPEQRDLILGRLVDSVTTFGDSGILKSSATDNPLRNVKFDITAKNN